MTSTLPWCRYHLDVDTTFGKQLKGSLWRRYHLDVDISSNVCSLFHVHIHLVCEFTQLPNNTVSERIVICQCWDGVVLFVCKGRQLSNTSMRNYIWWKMHLLSLTSTPMSTFYQLTSMRSYIWWKMRQVVPRPAAAKECHIHIHIFIKDCEQKSWGKAMLDSSTTNSLL